MAPALFATRCSRSSFAILLSNLITANVVLFYTLQATIPPQPVPAVSTKRFSIIRPATLNISPYLRLLDLLASSSSDSNLPTVYAITPTYARPTQKADLTTLCYTFAQVPKLVWIVVEDSNEKTKLVSGLLERCNIKSVHLNVRTSYKYRHKRWSPYSWLFPAIPKGVEQRNVALEWLRKQRTLINASGVVYFADDDNKYDVRVFQKIRKTQLVSVFPVGFTGLLKWAGPICENGKAVRWHVVWQPNRKVPIDMAGFALNLAQVMKSDVQFGVNVNGKDSASGQLETDFLEHFTTKDTVECRGSNEEIYVWHTRTQIPDFSNEKWEASDPRVEY